MRGGLYARLSAQVEMVPYSRWRAGSPEQMAGNQFSNWFKINVLGLYALGHYVASMTWRPVSNETMPAGNAKVGLVLRFMPPRDALRSEECEGNARPRNTPYSLEYPNRN